MQKLALFVLKSRNKKTCIEHIFMITFFFCRYFYGHPNTIQITRIYENMKGAKLVALFAT